MPETPFGLDHRAARVTRVLATPVLLLGAVAGWLGLSGTGVLSLACSVITSAVMVGGLVRRG